MGKIFCVEFKKGTFEIPHKISYPYIERCRLYSQVKIKELLDLRAHKCFWNAPQVTHVYSPITFEGTRLSECEVWRVWKVQ